MPVILPSSQSVNTQSPQSLALSPPQANSTPLGTPETLQDKSRPALPPKPAIKPPPRQTQVSSENDSLVPKISEIQDDLKSTENQIPGNNYRVVPVPQNNNQIKTVTFSQTNLQKPMNPPVSNNQQNLVPTTQMQNNNQITNINTQNLYQQGINQQFENMPIIKAKPLTIKKQPFSEQPKLRTGNSMSKLNGFISNNKKVEVSPAFHYQDTHNPEKISDTISNQENLKEKNLDEVDKIISDERENSKDKEINKEDKITSDTVIRRCKKGNLKQTGKANLSRRVSFDPLALLLDASLEGELELVKKTAAQVPNPSAANDEGITALHNAICAGHFEIVKFLVEFGCDVNAQDSDGWTPLHCAASCNNVAMVKFLVEHGACIFATTLSDHETAAEKCEEDEEGFDGCSEYLYSKFKNNFLCRYVCTNGI